MSANQRILPITRVVLAANNLSTAINRPAQPTSHTTMRLHSNPLFMNIVIRHDRLSERILCTTNRRHQASWLQRLLQIKRGLQHSLSSHTSPVPHRWILDSDVNKDLGPKVKAKARPWGIKAKARPRPRTWFPRPRPRTWDVKANNKNQRPKLTVVKNYIDRNITEWQWQT